MINGPIFALDLGQRSGFAVGKPGTIPRSGTVVLKKPSEHRSVAFANFIEFLRAEWSKERPGLVVTEAPLPLQAFAKLGNGESTVRMTFGLAGIVEAMCVRFGVKHAEVHDATARKHLIGKGRLGDRESTKRAVISRCIALGYLPRGCEDDNRADACCVFDWAAVYLARVAPKELHFFRTGVAA